MADETQPDSVVRPSRRVRALKFLARWAIYSVLVSVLLLIDLFGIDTKLEGHSSDIFNQVAGPFYPVTGREQMAVVLLDDPTVMARGATTRPPFCLHAKVLEQIRRHRPRAVMFDMYFVDPRDDPTLPELLDEVARFVDDGISFYMIAPPLKFRTLPEIMDFVSDFETGFRFVPAPFVSDEIEVDRAYPLRALLTRRSTAPTNSAAVQIYQDNLAGRFGPIQPGGRDQGDHMALFWGTQVEWTNAKWQRDCRNVMANPLNRLWQAVWDPVALRKRCFYTPTIPTAEFSLPACGEPGATPPTTDPDIPHLIRDRVVFYGTHLHGSQDFTMTPTHGRLPGVMLHAMALDNLITLNGRYLGDSMGAIDLGDLGHYRLTGDALEHVLAWILVLAVLTNRWFKATRLVGETRWHKAIRVWFDITAAGLAVLFIAGVALFTLLQFRLAPINWIGLFGLFALTDVLSRFTVVESVISAALQHLDRGKKPRP